MQQIKQLLRQPHAGVLVLSKTQYQIDDVYRRMMKDVARYPTDWEGWVFKLTPKGKINRVQGPAGQVMSFYAVRTMKDAISELSGLEFTNVIYSMHLGYQCQILYNLRGWMRSVEFKGVYSIEPMWDE